MICTGIYSLGMVQAVYACSRWLLIWGRLYAFPPMPYLKLFTLLVRKKSEQSLLRMLMLVFRQCQNRACQLEFGSAINYGINLLIKKKSSRDKMMCTSASKNTSTQIYILDCRNFSAVFFSFCLGLGMQVETGKKSYSLSSIIFLYIEFIHLLLFCYFPHKCL